MEKVAHVAFVLSRKLRSANAYFPFQRLNTQRAPRQTSSPSRRLISNCILNLFAYVAGASNANQISLRNWSRSLTRWMPLQLSTLVEVNCINISRFCREWNRSTKYKGILRNKYFWITKSYRIYIFVHLYIFFIYSDSKNSTVWF